MNGIVSRMGGAIHVTSAVGAGTSFSVFLPRIDAAAEQDGLRATAPSEVRGAPRILVVEDEPTVRDLARRLLERRGYRVHVAADASDALEVCRSLPSLGFRLVGIEWFVPVDGPNTATPRPYLFGQGFDGPMAGHEPGQPYHYDLHVWAWEPNPSGMFAQFNPNVNCSTR